MGIVIAVIMQGAQELLPWNLSPIPLTIIPMSAALGFLLGLGSLVGDTAGSFVKRRLGLKRGAPAPVLDQDDFIVGALLFAVVLVSVKLEWAILLLVITPIIHVVACAIGYLLKLKDRPY
jgi:CDP-2,3-bis-(O-geranylgeranyl)-sn-glycerol synthase